MSSAKTLMAFDFDHTIVAGNSSVEMQSIHPVPFTEEIKKLYVNGQNFMGAFYEFLFEKGFTVEQFKDKLFTISLIDGMKELFEYLRDDSYEVIIVSDANTLFIDWLTSEHGIRQQVDVIYSNPAVVSDEGKILMKPYHQQARCKLSTPNMCKGQILENHIKMREKEGVTFSKVCYVGDGGNDYCPALRLSADDYVFVRANYDLQTMIDEDRSAVKAKVVLWHSGINILDVLYNL